MKKCARDIRQIKSGYDLGTSTSRETPDSDNDTNSGVRFDVHSDAVISDANDNNDSSVNADNTVNENTQEQTAPTPRARRRRNRRIQITNEDGVNEQKWVSPQEDDAATRITSWFRSKMTKKGDNNQDNTEEQQNDTE